MPAGRKQKYNKETFPLLAEKYAREGLSDEQIAKNLGIATGTLYDYKNKFPEFSEALKRGKQPVDFEVENALLKRALGYDVDETVKIMNIVNGAPVVKEVRVTTKHIQPDVGAIAFWLKNRVPERWKERQTVSFDNGFFDDVGAEKLKEIADDFKKAANKD